MTTEKCVINAVVFQALKKGYTISVFDGEETTLLKSNNIQDIMGAVMSTGEDMLRFYKADKLLGSIYCVYGNQPDEVFADWSDKPEIEELLSLIGYL